MTTSQNAPDCSRTLALYKNAQPIAGVKCYYHWTGKIPCTGRQVCHLCGKDKQIRLHQRGGEAQHCNAYDKKLVEATKRAGLI